jgi:probable rRNA maturation factor
MEINILTEEDLETGLQDEWLQKIIETVLTGEQAPANAELSLVLTGQDRIQELNREYRGKDRPTDVLSFSLSETRPEAEQIEFLSPPDGLLHLGEVIISYPQALLQARESGHSLKSEILSLVVHGALHILGYDHEIAEKEPEMKARESYYKNLMEKETQ